jgi:hypothetical protein
LKRNPQQDFAALKRDTQRAVDLYNKYPHAGKLKVLEPLERGFRQEAGALGISVQDIEAAAAKLFVKEAEDEEAEGEEAEIVV